MDLIDSIFEIQREKTKLFDSVICTKTVQKDVIYFKELPITFCRQYKKAKDKKYMLFYEVKYNRWLVSVNNKFKKFSRLIKDFSA
ncbi:MAG: hypothetical protein V4538_15720 [Bacteroidota bacterium]